MTENDDLLNRIKHSFEEILKFSKIFDYEGYNFCQFRILSFKKDNVWIIEYMRTDFILEILKQDIIHSSKEGNALYVQFSKKIAILLDIIDIDEKGVFITIDDHQIYFNNNFKSISYSKIINGIKNHYPYQFNTSKTKLNFYYMHDLYSNYSFQQFKYQRENFHDTDTGIIYTGEDIFKDFMEMGYGLISHCFIFFAFPIYSFSFNYELVKGKDENTIFFKIKTPNKLKNSLEIFYQMVDETKRELKKKIILSEDFYGVITILINWYGDETFLPKGTILYKEEISVPKEEEIEDIKKEKKDFIETDFIKYQLPEYIGFKELINLCAYHPKFYRILPVLLRSLFENLLRDIFYASLTGEYTYLYYKQSRIRNFSKLMNLLKVLRKKFDSSYAMVIPDKIFEYMDKFRKDGNYNVHEIQNIIEKNYADKNKDKFRITLDILLQLHRKITTSRKKINKIDSNLLKKYEDKYNAKNKTVKIEKNQVSEISELISNIRDDFDYYLTKSLFERRISILEKKELQKKINDLSVKVIQLKLKSSSYTSLVISVGSLDEEFNSEFPHKKTLLDKINWVSTYFKYSISDIYSKESKNRK